MKKNILHLINSSALGGAETIVKELISKSKFPVFCLRKEKVERFREESKNVFFGTKSSHYKFNPFIFSRLLREIKKRDVEILHVHLANSLFYSYLVKRFIPDIKIIYHEHGEIFSNKKLIYFLKIFKDSVDNFIAVSEATKKALIEKAKIPENKIKVLYNFVDTKRFNRKNIKININKEKQKLGIKNNEFVIGFIGRLAKVKGCEYLIKALPYLDFPYKVVIAGDGPESKYLEKLSKQLKVNDKVIFIGYTNKPEDVYILLDVLIMPSLSEASPMAFYESQSLGIPVIGSNVPAINEFIIPNRNGFLFSKQDYKDLSKKILYLQKNINLLKRMKSFCIKNIRKYSLKNYIKNLNTIYSKI